MKHEAKLKEMGIHPSTMAIASMTAGDLSSMELGLLIAAAKDSSIIQSEEWFGECSAMFTEKVDGKPAIPRAGRQCLEILYESKLAELSL